jgi:hypothetical protein
MLRAINDLILEAVNKAPAQKTVKNGQAEEGPCHVRIGLPFSYRATRNFGTFLFWKQEPRSNLELVACIQEEAITRITGWVFWREWEC